MSFDSNQLQSYNHNRLWSFMAMKVWNRWRAGLSYRPSLAWEAKTGQSVLRCQCLQQSLQYSTIWRSSNKSTTNTAGILHTYTKKLRFQSHDVRLFLSFLPTTFHLCFSFCTMVERWRTAICVESKEQIKYGCATRFGSCVKHQRQCFRKFHDFLGTCLNDFSMVATCLYVYLNCFYEIWNRFSCLNELYQ